MSVGRECIHWDITRFLDMGAFCCDYCLSIAENGKYAHQCTSFLPIRFWFIYDFKLAFLADAEWLLSRLRTKPRPVVHSHHWNGAFFPQIWCRAAAQIVHGRHTIGLFRSCVQPYHGLTLNGRYMRNINDADADGIGHGRIKKPLIPSGDIELRAEDSGCH